MHAPPDRRPLTRFGMLALLAAAVTAVVGVRHLAVRERVAPETPADARSSARAASAGPTAAECLEALLQNERPKRLLRMIPYEAASQPQLSIAQLKTLGRPDQQFTFVGDYDQLRGCTIAEAVYKCGGNLAPGQHVSAIIFPASDRLLYAASARGVLQVIAAVEKSLDAAARGTSFIPADLQKRLPSPALAALDDTSNDAGRWINYRQYYRDYAHAVAEIRAAHCTVLDHIGSIDAIGIRWATPKPSDDSYQERPSCLSSSRGSGCRSRISGPAFFWWPTRRSPN